MQHATCIMQHAACNMMHHATCRLADGSEWIHDFDAMNNAAKGDWTANRYNWPKCQAYAKSAAEQCYSAANPGMVTTKWARWGAPHGLWTHKVGAV